MQYYSKVGSNLQQSMMSFQHTIALYDVAVRELDVDVLVHSGGAQDTLEGRSLNGRLLYSNDNLALSASDSLSSTIFFSRCVEIYEQTTRRKFRLEEKETRLCLGESQ